MEDAAEEGADTMRVAPVCFGSAESRTKEKRVRSLPGRGGLWPGPGLSTTTDPRASVLSLSLSLLVEFLFLFSSFFPFTLTRRRIHTQGTAAARGPFLIASFQRSIDGELIYRAGALSSLRLESRGVIDAPRRRAKERERERERFLGFFGSPGEFTFPSECYTSAGRFGIGCLLEEKGTSRGVVGTLSRRGFLRRSIFSWE